MKTFSSITFDRAECSKELVEYKSLLESKQELAERNDILPFFNKYRNLSALIGRYFPELLEPTDLAFEFSIVGDFVADVIVNDTVIVELKSVSKIVKAHEIQLVNYLVSTGKPVGLILNFAKDEVEVKRKVKDL